MNHLIDKNKPVVALTFDDGPNTITTVEILDKLELFNIKASFFVVGSNIDSVTAEVIRRAYQMGCEIGNHSNTHSNLCELTAEEIRSEITETSNKVSEITGEHPKFFRPPYLATNQTMLDTIDMPFIFGYGASDWDNNISAKERIERIISQAKDGAIFLLHDIEGNDLTVEALDTIIPELMSKGYQFVTLSKLFEAKNINRNGISGRIFNEVISSDPATL